MKTIGKAAELVSKAVGALRGKAAVLRARLLFLASPRRRAAVFAGISRHTRALTTPRQHKAKAAAQQYCHGGSRAALAPADDVEGLGAAGGLPRHLPVPASLLLAVQEGGGGGGGSGSGSDGVGCTADWTLALRWLFDDDEGGGDGYLPAAAAATDGLEEEEDQDGTSVIDVIRSRREGDGQEFRIEDEIDRAADMYIARVRRRMSAQLEDLIA
ncbi:hypothetical protein Zm00014a_031751 [Zea mays]|uniref:Uncharacterized protein n=1 Tax=Zea mays TaxID=4577 RepID=A0A317Y9E0_MAIZE|nr:hypothetical protein Zm00014a_031751 [Zea mays]